MKALVPVTLAVATVFLSSPQRNVLAAPSAQKLQEEAQRHVKKAQLHYDMGRWDAALAEYEAAYEISREPQLLYKMGDTYRRKGDIEHAVLLYQNYLERDPQNPFRPEIEERIKGLQRQLNRASSPAEPSPPNPFTDPAAPANAPAVPAKVSAAPAKVPAAPAPSILPPAPEVSSVSQPSARPELPHPIVSQPREVNAGTRTSMDANLARDGSYDASVTKQCTGDQPNCKSTLKVGGRGQDMSASYTSEEDCSNSSNEKCKRRTGAQANAQGIGLTYQSETITKVATRRSSAANFSFNLGGMYGWGDSIQISGLSTSVSLRILAGSRFPDENGGNWFGFFAEPSIGSGFGQAKVNSESRSSTTFMISGAAGGQWMNFGAQKDQNSRQRGFGLAAGIVGSAMWIKGMQGSSQSIGPTFNLIFPSYNPGTADYSAFQLNLMILPAKGVTTMIAGMSLMF